MAKKLPETNFVARKIFHLATAVAAGIFVLVSPSFWITYAAVGGFIVVFIFEFVRLNTNASEVVRETVGSLFKKKEYFEASGLFWLTVAALISVLFATPISIAFGLFVLGLADSAANLGGQFFTSRRLYHKKTLAGFLSFLIITSLISVLFLLLFVDVVYAISLALLFGLLLALVEMFSHPFDDNFTIMLFAVSLMEIVIKLF